MLSFFTGSGVWLALGGFFLLMFLIANVPRPQLLESFPWLLLSAAGFTIAYLPVGSGRRVWNFAVEFLWADHSMRWHCIAALILSVVGPFVTLGLSGVIPILTTHAIFHPLPSMWSSFKEPTGDEVWPLFILTSLLWPWAFPLAWIVASRWGGSYFGMSYFGTVLGAWVVGTISLTLLMFQRVFFFIPR